MLVIVVPSASVTDTVVVFVSVRSKALDSRGVITSRSVPVIISVVRPFFFVGMLVSGVVSAMGTDHILVKGMSRSLHKCVCVSAKGRTPVRRFVPLPKVRIEGVVLAYYVFAFVTKSVVVLVGVSLRVHIGNVVSAVCCVPVIVLILRPFCSVGMLVIVVPSASVTDTVVVIVGVSGNVLLYVVSAACRVPVILVVVRPGRFIYVSVIVIPVTVVADTVVVIVVVISKRALLDVVTAGNLVPVLIVVV